MSKNNPHNILSKRDFPKRFCPYSRPQIGVRWPKPVLDSKEVISEEVISDGHVLEETDNYIRVINFELDYSGCDYESRPDVTATITTMSKKDIPNPNYEEELKKYKAARSNHLINLREWNKWKKIWDENEERKTKLRELETLKKLKEKYETNTNS